MAGRDRRRWRLLARRRSARAEAGQQSLDRQTSAISSTSQASLMVEVVRAIWLTCGTVVRLDREIDLKTGALPSPAVDRKGSAQCLDTVCEADQTRASL